MSFQTFLCIDCGAEFTEKLPDGARINCKGKRVVPRSICRPCGHRALDLFWKEGGSASFLRSYVSTRDKKLFSSRRFSRHASAARKKERLAPDASGHEGPPRHNLRVRKDPPQDPRPDLEPIENLVGMD